MLFLSARVCARGSQCVAIMLMERESQGRPALAEGARRGGHGTRFSSDAERGTVVDRGEGEFSPGGPRDRGAGLVALSSLLLSISVLLKWVPGSHRTRLKTAIRMRLFLGSGVSFRLISSHWKFPIYRELCPDDSGRYLSGTARSTQRRVVTNAPSGEAGSCFHP